MFTTHRFTKFLVAAACGGISLLAPSPAGAAGPPTVIHDVVHDGHQVIPALAECPGDAADIEIWFHDTFQFVITATTFHLSETQHGRFESHDGDGNTIATGTFTNHVNDQGTGWPREVFQSRIKAVGRAVDGSPVRVTIVFRYTVNTAGQLTSYKASVDCGA